MSVKMKFVLIFLFPILSYSQDTSLSKTFPLKDNKVVFEKIDSTNKTAEEIYSQAKVWLANAFVSSNEVIQLDDHNSKIIGKGLFKFENKGGGSLGDITTFFTIDISIKEKKYRIRLYDYLITNSNTSDNKTPIEQLHKRTYTGLSKKYFINAEIKIKEESENIILSFSNAINKKLEDDF